MEPNETTFTPRKTYPEAIHLLGESIVIESSGDANDPWKFQSRDVRAYRMLNFTRIIVRETYANFQTNELRTLEFMSDGDSLDITTSKLEDPNKELMKAFNGMIGNLTEKLGKPPARRSPEEEAEYMARIQMAMANQIEQMNTRPVIVPVRCRLIANPKITGVIKQFNHTDTTHLVLWDGFEETVEVPWEQLEIQDAGYFLAD